MTQELLLFGGTFDPVHNGHLIIARAVAELRGFDRVLLIPTAQPPHKNGTQAPAGQRLEMLRLAVAGESLFDVCDVEIARGGASYTLHTLQELQRQYPAAGLHWIIGADMLEDLPLWHKVEEVLDIAQMVVAVRPPWNERVDQILQSLSGRLSREHLEALSRSVVNTPLIDISSNGIRRRLGDGKSVRFMVPDAVEQYIRSNGLYR
ncbi:MAG: nicotinate (nicotinamide) nucleotide adenylyltransferase [Planctomycetaceae bacterium]|nr:MAG: nicotinate (nicotinamide) nucleotide adenylyltransferase [Planctomycetaceae bacterium]